MISDLARHLDFANHHSDAMPRDIEVLCANVRQYGFNAAFVNPYYIQLAKTLLEGKAKAGTVLSFPLGQDTADMKINAALECINLGADELDIAPNNALLLSGEHDKYLEELKKIVDAIRGFRKQTVIKFILETGLFYPRKPQDLNAENKATSDELVRKGAKLIKQSGADFVKICSGMGPRGASLTDVRLVKEAAPGMLIKVAGGVDTYEEARGFLEAGADRIGTSQAIKIVEEAKPDQ